MAATTSIAVSTQVTEYASHLLLEDPGQDQRVLRLGWHCYQSDQCSVVWCCRCLRRRERLAWGDHSIRPSREKKSRAVLSGVCGGTFSATVNCCLPVAPPRSPESSANFPVFKSKLVGQTHMEPSSSKLFGLLRRGGTDQCSLFNIRRWSHWLGGVERLLSDSYLLQSGEWSKNTLDSWRVARMMSCGFWRANPSPPSGKSVGGLWIWSTFGGDLMLSSLCATESKRKNHTYSNIIVTIRT